MVNCAICGCKNHTRKTKGSDITYHRFPKNETLMKQWVIACKNSTQEWLNFISRGHLLSPSNEMMEAAVALEEEFIKMHGTSLSNDKYIFKRLAEKITDKLGTTHIPSEVIFCLARVRTYIRLRDLNRRISFENCKRQLNKKISKFTNFKK